MADNMVSVPEVKLGAKIERPGYEILIPGECLKPGSKMWSEEQRANGIWLSLVLLTSTEEEACLGEAQRSNNFAAINYIQTRKALVAMAPNVPVSVEVTAADGSSQMVEQPSPGPFARVPDLEKKAFWEELGPHGRSMAVMAFNTANTPSEAARAAAMASFRLAG